MLQQLEMPGIIQRDGDEKHYNSGIRLRKLAENLLFNSTMHDAALFLKTFEQKSARACNLTALSSGEIIYLDRAEQAPLRFHLARLSCARALLGNRQTVFGSYVEITTQKTDRKCTHSIHCENHYRLFDIRKTSKKRRSRFAIDDEE